MFKHPQIVKMFFLINLLNTFLSLKINLSYTKLKVIE